MKNTSVVWEESKTQIEIDVNRCCPNFFFETAPVFSSGVN